MKCPYCGYDNSYSSRNCVNCKKDMRFAEDLGEVISGEAENAGRLTLELSVPERAPIRPDFRPTIFLSALTMMLLLSSLSVTWYRFVTGTTYDFGIFTGHSRGVFEYSDTAMVELMSSTGVGVAFAALLMLALVTSSLFKLSWTSILISMASVVIMLIIAFRFLFGIVDAFPYDIDWSETTHGPQIGWYMVMLASGLQIGALLLLIMDEYGRHQRKAKEID